MNRRAAEETASWHGQHRPSEDRRNGELVARFAAQPAWRTVLVFISLAIVSTAAFSRGADTLDSPPGVKYLVPLFCLAMAVVVWLMGRYRYEARFDLKERTWYIRTYFFKPKTVQSGSFGDLRRVELKRCEFSPDMGGCSQVLYQVNVHGSGKAKVTLFMSESDWEARVEADLVARDLGVELVDGSREGA